MPKKKTATKYLERAADPADKLVQFTVRSPRKLRRDFQAKCKRAGVSVNVRMNELMARDLRGA